MEMAATPLFQCLRKRTPFSQYELDRPSSREEYATLRGRLAFVHAIDGDAVRVLLRRYGFNNINEVQ